MQIMLDTKLFSTIETDALVTYVFDESDPGSRTHRRIG